MRSVRSPLILKRTKPDMAPVVSRATWLPLAPKTSCGPAPICHFMMNDRTARQGYDSRRAIGQRHAKAQNVTPEAAHEQRTGECEPG